MVWESAGFPTVAVISPVRCGHFTVHRSARRPSALRTEQSAASPWRSRCLGEEIAGLNGQSGCLAVECPRTPDERDSLEVVATALSGSLALRVRALRHARRATRALQHHSAALRYSVLKILLRLVKPDREHRQSAVDPAACTKLRERHARVA